jgi:hypothetical protein
MERLFSPCTRLYDLLESQGRLEELRRYYHPELFQELNLDVSTEELLSAERAFSYADLCAMLGHGNTVAWLTPHAVVACKGGIAVMNDWMRLDDSCRLCFIADGNDMSALARSPEHLLEICDVVLRLLAVSVVHSVHLTNWNCDGVFISAPILANVMEQCQSLLFLSLNYLKMDEAHCRALGGNSRPGLEIVLDRCEVMSAGASALIEVLGRNQGPTKLNLCEIDNFVLAEGLRGNSHLKCLTPRFSSDLEVHDREFLAIAGALKENKGLVSWI